MECIRCQEASAVEPLGYCTTCFIDTKLEFAAGLRRLGDYLANWAAFEEWTRGDRRAPAGATS
jgi:hypothetical protein